jgi:hypothetical protein
VGGQREVGSDDDGGVGSRWKREKEEEKNCRREKEGSMVAALLLVRSWVGGDVGGQGSGDYGGGRRREYSLQKKNWRGGVVVFQFLHPIFFMLRP